MAAVKCPWNDENFKTGAARQHRLIDHDQSITDGIVLSDAADAIVERILAFTDSGS